MSGSSWRLTLLQAIDGLRGAGSIIVGVDFDGTLAPIVADPDMATADSGAMAALERLASMADVHVYTISGRGLADLIERIGPVKGVRLLGGHGLEAELEGDSDDLEEIRLRFAKSMGRLPGSWIEFKKHSLGFHYRAVTSDQLHPELDRLREWAESRDGIHVMESKRILEMSFRPMSKGSAIEQLRSELGVRTVVYVGDDFTDETVFETLRGADIGVKVGAGVTGADFRIGTIEETRDLLWAIAHVIGDRPVS